MSGNPKVTKVGRGRLQLPARWAEIAELKAAATGTKLDDYVRDLVKRDLSRSA